MRFFISIKLIYIIFKIFKSEIDKQEESEFFNVLEDGRVTRFNYQRFKAIELACNFFSILGVILSIFQVSDFPSYFILKHFIFSKFDKEYNDPQSDVNFVLLWFILVTTVILGVFYLFFGFIYIYFFKLF